jgi:hypothetical protein
MGHHAPPARQGARAMNWQDYAMIMASQPPGLREPLAVLRDNIEDRLDNRGLYLFGLHEGRFEAQLGDLREMLNEVGRMFWVVE